MPLLTTVLEQFGIQLSANGLISWVLSATGATPRTVGEHIQNLSAQGTLTTAGVNPILPSLVDSLRSGSTQELQFFSIVNQGTAANAVTLGKYVSTPGGVPPPTFFQFSPACLLQPAESMTYVKSEGFQVYDTAGNPRLSTVPNAPTAIAVQAHQTAAQSISDSTDTAVVFEILDFAQPTSMWSAGAPTKLVAPQTGVYQVTANVTYPGGTSTGQTQLWVRLNGASNLAGKDQGALSVSNTSVDVQVLASLVAGDYVEAVTRQGSGATMALTISATPSTHFSLALVR